MIKNIRIIIIVALRLFAVFFLASGLISILLVLLLNSGRVSEFSLANVAIPVVGGILLWLLAKPCADIVTHGIDE